jgi:hypothetical protein
MELFDASRALRKKRKKEREKLDQWRFLTARFLPSSSLATRRQTESHLLFHLQLHFTQPPTFLFFYLFFN